MKVCVDAHLVGLLDELSGYGFHFASLAHESFGRGTIDPVHGEIEEDRISDALNRGKTTLREDMTNEFEAAAAAPGWYPGENGAMRWWDGSQWTAAAPNNAQLQQQQWQQDKTLAIVAHISPIVAGFLGPLIVYLIVKNDATKSPWVKHHAIEALNFQISLAIYGTVAMFIGFILTIITFGLFLFILIPLFIAFALATLVLSIMATLSANKGEWYRYPMTIRVVNP